jgi:hypothetical protein
MERCGDTMDGLLRQAGVIEVENLSLAALFA